MSTHLAKIVSAVKDGQQCFKENSSYSNPLITYLSPKEEQFSQWPVSIPMSTICTPPLAGLFLYSFETEKYAWQLILDFTVLLEFDNRRQLSMNIYDKRDDLDFWIRMFLTYAAIYHLILFDFILTKVSGTALFINITIDIFYHNESGG